MQTYRIDLAVPSGFITPWQADTLFGHLCWVAERHDGFQNFKGATGLIDLFRSGEPPFILSDGFPSGFLPAPLTLKNLYQQSQEALDSSRYTLLKQVKKRHFLTLSQFQSFLRGDVPDLTDEEKVFISAITLHNQINRFTNTTGDQGSLFELDECFAPQGGVQIYVKVRGGFADDLKRLFNLFTQGGFGAKKSTGKGTCILTGFTPTADLDLNDPATQTTNGFVTLSHFVPAQYDPIDGAYKTEIKYGKLGEERTFCGNPFKKPFIMIRPGAVFKTPSIRPWYGRLIEGIAYADHQKDVVQYAFAFAVPAKLPCE